MTILEIGIGGYDDPSAGGNSLRLWRDYFPNGKIVGLDIYDKSGLRGDRIVTVQGDQSDATFLEGLAATYGPFDIVIDDGSHVVPHVRQSFLSLFPHVKDDGWYVIEDLHTSYWETFGGRSTPNGDPTTIDLLRELMDHMHYAELDVSGYRPDELDRTVVGVEVVPNIAFIRKGRNDAPSKTLGYHPHDKVHYAKPQRRKAITNPAGSAASKRLRRLARALAR